MAGQLASSSMRPRRGPSFITSTGRASMAAIEPGAARDASWRLWSVLTVAALLIAGAGLGFIVLPVVQGWSGGIDAYTAICRALGVAPGSPARSNPTSDA